MDKIFVVAGRGLAEGEHVYVNTEAFATRADAEAYVDWYMEKDQYDPLLPGHAPYFRIDEITFNK